MRSTKSIVARTLSHPTCFFWWLLMVPSTKQLCALNVFSTIFPFTSFSNHHFINQLQRPRLFLILSFLRFHASSCSWTAIKHGLSVLGKGQLPAKWKPRIEIVKEYSVVQTPRGCMKPANDGKRKASAQNPFA